MSPGMSRSPASRYARIGALMLLTALAFAARVEVAASTAMKTGADAGRDPGGCEGCRVKVFDFDRVATLGAGGRQLRVSGPAGACPVQDKLFLTVQVTQGGVTARGSWAKHACTGQQQHWHVLLTTASGKTLKSGSALGHGSVTFTHNGKTLLTHTWTKKIALTSTAARSAGAEAGRDPGGCATCRVKVFDFDRVATLGAGGRQLRVSGPAGACPVQDKLFLTVQVTQGGVTARGSWAKHACTGQQQHWHVLLTTASGKTLKSGSALGHGSVTFTHNGKTLLTHTWTKKIALT